MYPKIKIPRTSMSRNESAEGETIEQKMERILNNKESITDGAPITYTDRKDGVLPAYDVRTDRFDVAIDAMDTVAKTETAKREQRLKDRKDALEEASGKKKQGEDGGTESTQGTSNNGAGSTE